MTAMTKLSQPNRRHVPALAMQAAWLLLSSSLVGLVFALPRLAGATPRWAILLSSLADWWSWALLLPVILLVDARLPLHTGSLGRRLALHVPLGLAATALYAYLDATMQALVGTGPWTDVVSRIPAQRWLGGGFLWSLIIYLLIVGGWQAVMANRAYLGAQLQMSRLERNFSEARLNALRMQLDPHFLFNALNTISAQVTRSPAQARRMIEQLGELLRLSLEPDNRREVRLEEELGFLGHYVAIQQVRFGDQLQVTLDIADATRGLRVPSLILQPLVENAIRHGLAPRLGGGWVHISAERIDGSLRLIVDDNGVGLPADFATKATGLGLGITHERITLWRAGEGATLSVGPRAGGGTRVEIRLPAHEDARHE